MTDATAIFHDLRGYLLGIGYRMLGEMAAAEDVVQDAWIRWQRADHDVIQDARAWLSTVTIRLALDALRSARTKRERYVGPWLPEPILPDDQRLFTDVAPDTKAELASDLSVALLHVLERLSPEERAAFILHDAFDCDYPDIAATLGKSEVACRKLVSRARERVQAERPRFTVTKNQHRDLLARFAQAATTQDTGALMQMLAPDAEFYSDGGGRVPAALLPVYGADRIARLAAGLMRKSAVTAANVVAIEVNGQPALLYKDRAGNAASLSLESDGARITRVFVMRNPDKLARLLHEVSWPTSPGSSPSARQ